MTAHQLFHLALKLLGIYLLQDVLKGISSLLYLLYDLIRLGAKDNSLAVLALSLLTFGIYISVAYLLLIKTDWIIEKLQLTRHFPAGDIPLNVHRSTVLSIALLLVAFLTLLEAVPSFVSAIGQWWWMKQNTRLYEADIGTFQAAPITLGLQIIASLLIIGHLRRIVNFFERKRR
jgi:hypothetical protein